MSDSQAYVMVDHIVGELQNYVSAAISEAMAQLAAPQQAITNAQTQMTGVIGAIRDSAALTQRPAYQTDANGAVKVATPAAVLSPDGQVLLNQVPPTPGPLPASFDLSKIDQTIANEANRLSTEFKNAADTFMNTYFPADPGQWASLFAWADANLNYEFTSDNRQFRQAFEQGRARILADIARAQDESLVAWASKGYPIPPGAAIEQRNTIDQDARDKIADLNRSITIDQGKLALDAARLSKETQRAAAELYANLTEQQVKVRALALEATANYLNLLIIPERFALEKVGMKLDAETKMMSAMLEYYRVWNEAVTMPVRGQQGNADRMVGQVGDMRRAFYAKSSEWVDLGKTMVSQAGQRAATAINALHAQAAVTGSERMLDNNL